MTDPWAMSVAVLALLGQIPNFVGNWEGLINKIKKKHTLSEVEITESELTLLEARLDWLTYKILLLDLVVAFSNDHLMDEKVVEFCKSTRPEVFAEFQIVKDKLVKLTEE